MLMCCCCRLSRCDGRLIFIVFFGCLRPSFRHHLVVHCTSTTCTDLSSAAAVRQAGVAGKGQASLAAATMEAPMAVVWMESGDVDDLCGVGDTSPQPTAADSPASRRPSSSIPMWFPRTTRPPSMLGRLILSAWWYCCCHCCAQHASAARRVVTGAAVERQGRVGGQAVLALVVCGRVSVTAAAVVVADWQRSNGCIPSLRYGRCLTNVVAATTARG